MLPKLNRQRALFVLTKIDEILAWEQEEGTGARHPVRGTGALPVRGSGGAVLAAGKPEVVRRVSWQRRFPESRRKAYYLMSIHEHLPPQARKELKEMGWTKGRGAGEGGAQGRAGLRLCNLVAQSP